MAPETANKSERTLKLLLDTGNDLLVPSQLVISFIKEGLTTEAESLFVLLLKMGCKPNISTLSSMIYLYGKQNQVERAKQVFAALPDSSAAQKLLYTCYIDVFVKSVKLDKAYLFYEENKKG